MCLAFSKIRERPRCLMMILYQRLPSFIHSFIHSFIYITQAAFEQGQSASVLNRLDAKLRFEELLAATALFSCLLCMLL